MRTIKRTSAIPMTCLLVAYLVACVTSQSFAQPAVATRSATATIVTPIVVTSTTSLVFGNVTPGVTKTVSRTATGIDTTAAVFTISGDPGAGILVQFTLPEYMSATSGDRMQLLFSSSSCTVDSLAGTPAIPGAGAWIGVNPRALPALKIGATNSSTSIYLGGKVIPQPRQTAGSYSADIVISVSYDGT